MKKANWKFIFLTILLLGTATMYFITLSDLANEEENNQKLKDNLELKDNQIKLYREYVDSVRIVEVADSLKYTEKYNHTKDAMVKYNPDINDSTVHLFLNVVEAFRLDTTEFLFNVCISQLLKESGAQQRYSSRYGGKSGKLVISTAHAVGIAQIQGPTGYHFLHLAIENGDDYILNKLGCDDFSFAESGNTSSNRQKAWDWLKKENNNLILWGYIMKETISSRDGNLTEALVCYNAGIGNFYKMKRGNVNLNNFSYVKNIYYLSNKRMKA